jgi:hypothetical protein
MTTWVLREGLLVDKATVRPSVAPQRSDLPAPMLSRMEAFESPVTGKEISSWRERDRDMAAAGAVDPRDLPARPFEARRKANERQRKLKAEWGGGTPGTAPSS